MQRAQTDELPASELWLFYLSLTFSGFCLAVQAFHNAPTSDEIGHLVSGMAMIQTGDPGFYRVNPPIHKLISGLAASSLPGSETPAYPASSFRAGIRHEFLMAKKFISQHKDDYGTFLVAGRLIRLPFVLLAGWLVFRIPTESFRLSGIIAAVLFLTSPMVLGHGWAIMPDAMSAVFATLLLATTLRWLRVRTTYNLVLVGIAWGIAIGTKFTFCPLYLVWGVGLLLAEKWSSLRNALNLIGAHCIQGGIALIVVNAIYGFADIGVTLDHHDFQSDRMQFLSDHFGSWPSPFPKQFLVGIDEQQLDLEEGLPTYVLGTKFPNGLPWYYLVGVMIKEQLAFIFLAVLSLWSLATGRVDLDIHSRRCAVMSITLGLTILVVLSANWQMALNVRYLLPALPAAYLLIGIAVEPLWKRFRVISIATGALICLEAFFVFPHYFSYASPLLGGSWRVPPALHDSNFDGGQDLWRLANWLEQNPPKLGTKRYLCVNTSLPLEAIGFAISAPPHDELRSFIRGRSSTETELIVMRGLLAPPPWTSISGGDRSHLELLQGLLSVEPTEWITPTVAIYRSK